MPWYDLVQLFWENKPWVTPKKPRITPSVMWEKYILLIWLHTNQDFRKCHRSKFGLFSYQIVIKKSFNIRITYTLCKEKTSNQTFLYACFTKISNNICSVIFRFVVVSLHWRHNDHDGVSNHQPHGCLLNRIFGRRSKKISKLRVTGLCAGN